MDIDENEVEFVDCNEDDESIDDVRGEEAEEYLDFEDMGDYGDCFSDDEDVDDEHWERAKDIAFWRHFGWKTVTFDIGDMDSDIIDEEQVHTGDKVPDVLEDWSEAVGLFQRYTMKQILEDSELEDEEDVMSVRKYGFKILGPLRHYAIIAYTKEYEMTKEMFFNNE
jgi:hypothetical protein